MVPKLTSKGTSFKGAAAYLLHDKGRIDTSERVAWVETVNLATSNPQAAWRVMAATAMDAGRLKEQAGVKKTGRTSKEAVLHLTLAWSPDQKPDRQEMASFARRALEALKADDRQAMIICHTDEEHPHVHVLINRVSPADGRMLSSSKEKLALSALALEYEKEGGTIYCKEREANAEKRKQGEYVRGEKDIPRPEYEALQGALKDAEAAIPARLIAEKPKMVSGLRASMKGRLRAILGETRHGLRPGWAALYQRQRGEVQNGRQEKGSLLGRLTGWIGQQTDQGGASLPFLRQNLKGLPAQARGRRRRQEAERRDLQGAYSREIGKAIAELKQVYARTLGRVLLRHDMTKAATSLPRPASPPAGNSLTAIQRRAVEVTNEAKRQETARPPASRVRDREFEP
jgi:Relaxase/Mobilisation nuclease domain